MMNIKVYSTPTCPYCVMAKEYFKTKNIEFEDFNVSQDHQKAEEMIRLSGQTGVPVISIDDKIIIGFDKEEIEKILSTK